MEYKLKNCSYSNKIDFFYLIYDNFKKNLLGKNDNVYIFL